MLRPQATLLLCLGAAAAAAALLLPAARAVSVSADGRFVIIPDTAPYPKTKPVDAGYPGNVPADLPKAVPAPPPVLQRGPAPPGGCAAGVRDVLTKHGRGAFLALLQASAEGRAVLDGGVVATVLAPSDAALARLGVKAGGDPLAQATIANYHILQGRLPLERLLADAGLWLNTTLTKADCPTALQTVSVMPGNVTDME